MARGTQNAFSLHRRVILSGYVETVTAIRVSQGRAVDAAAASDLPVMKDALGRPFIPGSSLKGVLRSFLESVIRGAGGPLRTCDPIARDYTGCVNPADYSRQQKEGVPAGATRIELPRDLCDVCDLFGHPSFASRLVFRDLPVLTDSWHELLLQVRDGVAIDRETGTVHGGQKYDFEIVPAGVRFDLRITADNPEDWQLGLLFVAVDALNSGFAGLGGARSRGLGSVQIQFTSHIVASAAELLTGTARLVEECAEFQDTCASALEAEIKQRSAGCSR